MNLEDKKEVVVPVEVPSEKTELELVQEKLAKAEEDRDNYKAVALKRKGKLPGDAEFFEEKEIELSVAEQVKIALLDREVENANKAKEILIQKQSKEISELKLALKNRPGSSGVGGDGGSSVEVKDNVFSEQQLNVLRAKAKRLNADPEKFIQAAKDKLR